MMTTVQHFLMTSVQHFWSLSTTVHCQTSYERLISSWFMSLSRCNYSIFVSSWSCCSWHWALVEIVKIVNTCAAQLITYELRNIIRSLLSSRSRSASVKFPRLLRSICPGEQWWWWRTKLQVNWGLSVKLLLLPNMLIVNGLQVGDLLQSDQQ